ncbi:MAG: hypothetical protein JO287_17440, partial [Pseudonocardiales bacterium]|nr:hypothetical protein [Pseudonocardiales bacterium]
MNALYGALSSDPVQTLHLRCRDRNGRHTLFMTTADHVPSAPRQSAVVAAEFDAGPAPTPGGGRVAPGGLVKLGVAELRDALHAAISQAGDDGSAV